MTPGSPRSAVPSRCLPLRLFQKNTVFLCLLSLASLLCLLLYSLRDSPRTPISSDVWRKPFTIHVWRHGERMKRRFMRSYGTRERNPFDLCSVSNCVLSTADSRVGDADAVLFHLHQTKGPGTLPPRNSSDQVWIFFTDESPLHTFLLTRKYSMRDYNGIFNWSMTYRSDSDVPVPYGRTVALSLEEMAAFVPVNHARTKTRDIAILGSNCGGRNHRWDYVRRLREHISVDVFGGCGNHTCPGHFMMDCPVIANYKFYLAFENSNCDEYITEKMWWNAFHKGAVPVVMGAPKADYEKLCPPGSFIHVSDFDSPEALALYLRHLLTDTETYNAFFEWRRKYKVLNEHGYFGSPSLHLCRICEALNQKNRQPKTYSDLSSFWNPESDCHPPAWSPL